jgi:hypothetical protein
MLVVANALAAFPAGHALCRSSAGKGEPVKKFLLAGAVVLFAGVACTVAAAAEHRAPKHAPARASMTASAPTHKDAAPKKHHGGKKHHARAHKAHHAKK